MALIPDKRELGPLGQLASRPQFSPAKDYIGDAMSDLGKSVQQAGQLAFNIVEEQTRDLHQQQSFATTQHVQQLDIGADNDLIAIDTKAPVTGYGMTKQSLAAWDKRADALRNSTPEWLRPKLDPLLATKRMAFEQKAGLQETEKRNGWYRTGVSDSQSQAQQTIFNDPAQFDQARDNVLASIRSSGLPQAEKDKLERETLVTLGKAKFERQKLDDPDAAGSVLGVAKPGTVIGPGDHSLPAGMRNNNPGNLKYSSGVRSRFSGVVGPSVNTDQGDHQAVFATPEDGMRAAYELALGKYQGGKTTANELIAGQGGWTPGNRQAAANVARTMGIGPDEDLNLTDRNGAARFLRALVKQEHGQASAAYSDDMIMASVDNAPNGSRTAVDLPIVGQGGKTIDLPGVQPLVLERFSVLQNHWGRILPVNSGFRDPEKNAAVGGAKGSQHMHGNALDIDVSRLNEDERKQLIGMASAAGFTGLGVYQNALHLDTGPRRAWGPSHHGDSVPAWAQGAVGAHMDGNPDGATGGAPLTTPGTTLDPAYAAIPFADRLEMAQQATRAGEERTKIQLAQQKANYEALKGNFEKRIVLGEATEQDVLSSPLDDGDQASLIRSIRAEQKQRSEADLAADSLLSGGMGVLNPRDTNAMGDLNRAYNTVLETRLNGASDEERQAFTIATIRQTHVLPQKVQATIEAGVLDTDDPPQLSQNLTTAAAIEDQVPAAFKQLDEGARKAVADYRYQTLELGRSSDQATAKILAGRTPEAKAAEKLYGDAADKVIRGSAGQPPLAVSDVTSAFRGWVTTPGTGAGAAEQDRLLREYQDAFRDAMLQTQGDVGRAKKVALAQLRTTWDVSTVSGSGQLMRLPPEKFYPQIDGSHDYLRDDAMKQAREWLDDGEGEAPKPQGRAVSQAREPVPGDQLRPFSGQEYRQNADGSFSTEVTVTVQDAAGKWMNVPSLWNSDKGWVDLGDNEDAATEIASGYEQRTGKSFPRFDDLGKAEAAAETRSASGGTQNGRLAGSNGGGRKREITDVYLWADGYTAKDINAVPPKRPSYAMTIIVPDENGDGEPEKILLPHRWAVPDDMVKSYQAKERDRAADEFRRRDQRITDRRETRDRADTAARQAIDTTVGPDWMKASAGNIAREQTLMGVGPAAPQRPAAVVPQAPPPPSRAALPRSSKQTAPLSRRRVIGSIRGETTIPGKGGTR